MGAAEGLPPSPAGRRVGDRLLEKVRVRSRPLEDNDAGVEFVHQEPVRFDVALTPPGEFSFQCVVSESWIQRHFLNQRPHNRLKF